MPRRFQGKDQRTRQATGAAPATRDANVPHITGEVKAPRFGRRVVLRRADVEPGEDVPAVDLVGGPRADAQNRRLRLPTERASPDAAHDFRAMGPALGVVTEHLVH